MFMQYNLIQQGRLGKCIKIKVNATVFDKYYQC